MDFQIDLSRCHDPEEVAKTDEFWRTHQPSKRGDLALQRAIEDGHVLEVIYPDGHVGIVGE